MNLSPVFVALLSLTVAASTSAQCLNPNVFPESVDASESNGRTVLTLQPQTTSLVGVRNDVSIVGNEVRINIDFADGACITGAPPTPQTVFFPLPSILSPGSYQLVTSMRRLGQPPVFMTTRNFVVTGTGSVGVPVPGLSSVGGWALFAATLLIGLLAQAVTDRGR